MVFDVTKKVPQQRWRVILHALVCVIAGGFSARANEPPRATPSFLGPIGLNLIPSARMDPVGTVRIGAGTIDPYLHGYAGAQVLDDVYIQVRQSAEVSGLTRDPDALHPGLDIKWRLSDEGRYQPEVVVGINSAFGHRRTAGEYFALSKRWNDFDATLGMGWGRSGSAGHLKNPLARLSGHFAGQRDLSSDDPNNMTDWFTGNDVGFFGGIEYATPLRGVSLKADYSADRYVAETRDIAGFHRPAPWSISVNYAPFDFMSAGVGVVGTDSLMARLSFSGDISKWPGRGADFPAPPTALPLHRAGDADIDAARREAHTARLTLIPAGVTDNIARAALILSPDQSSGFQVGRAARSLSAHGGQAVESLEIQTRTLGLRGPRVALSRRDVEAEARRATSPEEIWQDAEFLSGDDQDDDGWRAPGPWSFFVSAEQRTGLSEQDSGLLYRTSVALHEQKYHGFGLVTGSTLRLNVTDNLATLDDLRLASLSPVRSDERAFADTRLSLDRAYAAWMKTLWPDMHVAITGGYLEEMFAGANAEILWRPFGRTFAIGAEGAAAMKRDPDTPMNVGLVRQSHTSALLNLFYELPETDITLFTSAGRYLAGDVGATFGTMTTLNNGLRLSAYITATNRSDPGPYGDTLPVMAGLRLTLPIGNIPFVPDGSSVSAAFDPIARDAGQRIQKPLPLYEVTEPVSYRRLARSWGDFLN